MKGKEPRRVKGPRARERKFNEVIGLLVEYLQKEKPFASIKNAFDLCLQVKPNFAWHAANLEMLSNYITAQGQIARVDLKIPHDNPLRIFKGHYKMSLVPYFILSDENAAANIEKAQKDLDSLTNQALQSIPLSTAKKPKPKQVKADSITLTQYLYINRSRIRSHLLHLYIKCTFGFKPFTLDECLESMPFSLMIRVFRAYSLPHLFITSPLLCNLVYKSLPNSVLEHFGRDIKDELGKLLGNISNGCIKKSGYGILIKKDLVYQLTRYQRFEFLNRAFIQTDDVCLIWQSLRTSELFEHMDQYSKNVWLKRYLLYSSRIYPYPFMIEPSGDYIIPSDIEEMCKINGANWIYLMPSLPQPDIQHIPTNGPIDFFTEGSARLYHRFNWNPHLLFDVLEHERDRALSYYVAMASLTETGYVCNLEQPWDIIRKLVTGFASKDNPKNIHWTNIQTNPVYREHFYETLAVTSSYILRFSDGIGIKVAEYYKRFHLATLKSTLPIHQGEMVERLKMLSNPTNKRMKLTAQKEMLMRLGGDLIEGCVLFLKYTRFLSTYRSNFFFLYSHRFMGMFGSEIHHQMLHAYRRSTEILLSQHREMNFTGDSSVIVMALENFSRVRCSDSSFQWVIYPLHRLPALRSLEYHIHPPHLTLPLGFDYPSDDSATLQEAFSQMYIISYQLTGNDIDIVPRLVYSLIFNSRNEPVSYDSIRDTLHITHQELVRSIHFLIEYDYAYQISATSVTPYYVSDVYASLHLLPCNVAGMSTFVNCHLWTVMDGSIDDNVLLTIKAKIHEYVIDEPGIAFGDILFRFASLSALDLQMVLSQMELDEVICIRWYREIPGSLTQSYRDIPIARQANELLSFSTSQTIAHVSDECINVRIYECTRSWSGLLNA